MAKTPEMTTDRYLARMCWNSEGWIYPTGESSRIEHNTYVTANGYGHEEWLFNFEWILDGWKYGFLQPVNRSFDKVKGQTIDVRLYTIGPENQWFYVGRLPRCEVITEGQAKVAWSQFVKRGWAEDMKEQVTAIQGKVKGLRVPHFIFNIRFRPGEAEILDPREPVGGADAIRRLRRYTLTSLQDERAKVVAQWPDRQGTSSPRKTSKQLRRAVDAVEVNLAERQLQNHLFNVLRKQYGAGAASMEEGYADVTLRQGGLVHLFEVKADPRPRRAIRQALGQLLEYAFGRLRKGQHLGLLVVAAPGDPDDLTHKYVEHLRTVRGLPLHYLCLQRGTTKVELPFGAVRS